MSGHSKWATTKRAKAVVDAKRAGTFTRLANLVTIAAREKGGDMETNFSLRLAVEKARSANMPKDNIERAIKRGLGTLEGEQLEEIVYEGYGPGGVAIIIEVLTNNRNRSASEIKHLLSKYGGNLGAQNSVQWMFEKKGTIGVPVNALTEEGELLLIEAGAEDISKEGAEAIIYSKPEDLQKVKNAIESLHVAPSFVEFDYLAKTKMSLDQSAMASFEKLCDDLDDHGDVTNHYCNLE